MMILVLLLALSYVDAQGRGRQVAPKITYLKNTGPDYGKADIVNEEGWVLAGRLTMCEGTNGVNVKKLPWVAGMDVNKCARAVTADADCGLTMYFTGLEGKKTCTCVKKGHFCKLKKTQSANINVYYNTKPTYERWKFIESGYCKDHSQRNMKDLDPVSGGTECAKQAMHDNNCGSTVLYIPVGGLCRCVRLGGSCEVKRLPKGYSDAFSSVYKRELPPDGVVHYRRPGFLAVHVENHSLQNYAVHSLSVIGFIAVAYGAGMYFFGKSQTHEEL